MKKCIKRAMTTVVVISLILVNCIGVGAISGQKTKTKLIGVVTFRGITTAKAGSGSASTDIFDGSTATVNSCDIDSVFKYKNSSGTIKTVPADSTCGGQRYGYGWSYTLNSANTSYSISSVHRGGTTKGNGSFSTEVN